MKRDKTRPGCYEAEVFTKGILRVSGKRRVDLNIRVFSAGQEDREFLVYANSIKSIKKYLSKKYAHHAKVCCKHSIVASLGLKVSQFPYKGP